MLGILTSRAITSFSRRALLHLFSLKEAPQCSKKWKYDFQSYNGFKDTMRINQFSIITGHELQITDVQALFYP
jgi:hypothetical protein